MFTYSDFVKNLFLVMDITVLILFVVALLNLVFF